MNRLINQRVYLAGAMDRVADRGSTWRDNITPFLESWQLIVFNPITKLMRKLTKINPQTPLGTLMTLESWDAKKCAKNPIQLAKNAAAYPKSFANGIKRFENRSVR